MINIIKEDLDIDEALKKKLEFVCSFCNTKCEIQKGSIRTIERTNLSYVEPHRIIIKPKNKVWDENEKLKEEIDDLKRENSQLKYKYEESEKENHYLLYYIKKFIDKMPKVIKDIIENIFEGSMTIDLYKRQCDPEMLEK